MAGRFTNVTVFGNVKGVCICVSCFVSYVFFVYVDQSILILIGDCDDWFSFSVILLGLILIMYC